MSLVRDFPFTMVAVAERPLITCSTTGSTGTLAGPLVVSTADSIVSTGDLGQIATGAGTKLVSSGGMGTNNGRVIDRLRFPIGARYGAAVVSAYIASTRGSTEADRKLAVGVKLQHGDSSGGGDLADYSTANQPDDRLYFGTSVRTCDMLSWDLGDESTGAVYAVSNSGYYDLRGAKRYLRVVGRFGKDLVTTESSGDEQARCGATITFLAGDQIPQKADTTGPYSSTTSTA